MAGWTLEKLLAKLGVGSRKECHRLIRSGQVSLNGALLEEPDTLFPVLPPELTIGNEVIPVQLQLYLLLHKPLGTECSHKPQNHASVFSLFPARMLTMGLQCVGRLDVDTSGLLLLSNQGEFIHAVESPRKGIGKTYRAVLAQPLSAEMCDQLQKGVALRSEKGLYRALALEMQGERTVDITIGEGVYHQVRRMFAAVGNRVEELQRLAIGNVKLPADLAPGAWRWMLPDELKSLGVKEIL